jgi:hypothetical protein
LIGVDKIGCEVGDGGGDGLVGDGITLVVVLGVDVDSSAPNLLLSSRIVF